MIQLLRILEALNNAAVPVSLVVLADQSKVPEQFITTLRARTRAEIFNLDHEVAYDRENLGGKVDNVRVMIESLWKIFGPEGEHIP